MEKSTAPDRVAFGEDLSFNGATPLPMTRPCLLLTLTLFIATGLEAAELTPGGKGIDIAAGSLGTFTLTYPEFLDASSATVNPAIEVKTGGTSATVRYQGGAECTIAIDAGGVRLAFDRVPESVKQWRMTLLIDIAFAKGGSWRIGGEEGDFPAEKATPPQIASLNGTDFQIKNAQGQFLGIITPYHAFQQLTDNREWNWAVYHWQVLVPFFPDKTTSSIRISSELGSTTRLIDPFGQSLVDSFPDKLTDLESLKTDATNEIAYYAGLTPPELDRFGGMPGSGASLGLKKTGFFHVGERSGKSWLVDPDGNVFFHLGVCGFGPNDDYTYVKGREGIYEWLPPLDGEYASAFRPGDGDSHFSFYLANTIRKFGAPYDYDTHAARMIPRVRKWGFNSIGAFSPAPPSAHEKADFPYVAHLPINEWEGVARIPGAHEVWDPFDETTEAKLAENIAREVPLRADDPLLIGWFIVNEPRFDELPRVIPSLDGGHACKRRFVSGLEKKYQTIAAFNAAWGDEAASFEDLHDKGLAVTTDTAKTEVKAFVDEFLETYFAQIERLYRQHDPNHLLLGCRLQPITIEDESLCRIMGRHLDVVSYNYYTYGVDTEALRRYHEWSGGKPMILSEFFWASPKDSGLIGGREVNSQRERGLAYRNYVEQSAALGFVIGIEWFTLVDQATTGRWFSRYNGESYNTGLISVADRPWKEMLAEMIKTNHSIYDLLLGKRAPFLWDDPRFRDPASAPR